LGQGSKQWKVSQLEAYVEKSWEFKDIVSLLNKHKYIVKEKRKARKKKTDPKFSTRGFGAIQRKMHPITSPNVKKLIIRDYIKLQEELGLPFGVKKQENTLQRRHRKLLEDFGIEHFFYMYGSLALNKELFNLMEREIQFKESALRTLESSYDELKGIGYYADEARKNAFLPLGLTEELLSPRFETAKKYTHYQFKELEEGDSFESYNSILFEAYSLGKSKKEKLIFFSAVKRILENDVIDKDKVLNKSKLYSLLISLYKKFAKDDDWRLSNAYIYYKFPPDLLPETKLESIESAALEFAERLIYGVTSFDSEDHIIHITKKMSEFLCNVEDYEKGKGKWKSIEHFYKEKYFPTATKY